MDIRSSEGIFAEENLSFFPDIFGKGEECNLCPGDKVVIFSVKLLDFGLLASFFWRSFGGGNVEINVGKSAQDAVGKPDVKDHVINPPFLPRAVLPGPGFIALPFFEGGRGHQFLLPKETTKELGIIIGVFLMVITEKFTHGGTHSRVGVKKPNDFGLCFLTSLKKLRKLFPPSFPFSLGPSGVWSVSNNGVDEEKGRRHANNDPAAVFLRVSKDSKLISLETMTFAVLVTVRGVAVDLKFYVPASTIGWTGNSDDTMSLPHHFSGGGCFLDPEHVIFEVKHLSPDHFNPPWDMKTIFDALPILTKGEHVGSACLQEDLGFGANVVAGNLREIVWNMGAAFEKGKVLKPNLLTIADWESVFVLWRKGGIKQELGLAEVLHHICWQPKQWSWWLGPIWMEFGGVAVDDFVEGHSCVGLDVFISGIQERVNDLSDGPGEDKLLGSLGPLLGAFACFHCDEGIGKKSDFG